MSEHEDGHDEPSVYYVVLSIVSKATVVTPLGRHDSDLRMTEGQVGILPVFASYGAAERHVASRGISAEIIEVETVPEATS